MFFRSYRRVAKLACVCLCASGMVQIAAAQNLLVNGDFELNDRQSYPNYYPSVDLAYITQGETVAGWTFGHSVDLYGPVHAPLNGNQYLDLVGGGPLSSQFFVQQTFATTPGATYNLLFYYGNNEALSAAIATFTASIIGGLGTLWNQSFSHTGDTNTFHDWTFFSTTFTADSSSTVLRFLDTSNFATSYDPTYSVGGATLDGVVISSVPEPGGVAAVLVIGTVCLGPVLRRQLAIYCG
jgi:hypothetical protein